MSQIVVQINPDVPPTGSDLGICNAARKSFGRRSEWEVSEEPTTDFTIEQGGNKPTYLKLKDKDKRLLEFLARGMTSDDFDELLGSVSIEGAWNSGYISKEDGNIKELTELLWQWRNTPTHDTPFNHGFFSFEVKAPIFVARHLVKHEYLIMSEYSRRYITDDVEFYQPEVWRKAADDVKQGSSSEGVDNKLGEGCNLKTNVANEMALELYNDLISTGVAPEQARMVLPQSLMTSFTFSGTLGAFANLCKLRMSKDSQYETRIVAEKIYEHLKNQFPISAPLLVYGCADT